MYRANKYRMLFPSSLFYPLLFCASFFLCLLFKITHFTIAKEKKMLIKYKFSCSSFFLLFWIWIMIIFFEQKKNTNSSRNIKKNSTYTDGYAFSQEEGGTVTQTGKFDHFKKFIHSSNISILSILWKKKKKN